MIVPYAYYSVVHVCSACHAADVIHICMYVLFPTVFVNVVNTLVNGVSSIFPFPLMQLNLLYRLSISCPMLNEADDDGKVLLQ